MLNRITFVQKGLKVTLFNLGGIHARTTDHLERNPFLPSELQPPSSQHFVGLDMPPPFMVGNELVGIPPRSPLQRDPYHHRLPPKASSAAGLHQQQHSQQHQRSHHLKSPSDSIKSMLAGHSSHRHTSNYHHLYEKQRSSEKQASVSSTAARMFGATPEHMKTLDLGILESTKERMSRYPAHIELDRATASAPYQHPLFLDLQERSSSSSRSGTAPGFGMYPPPEMLGRHTNKSPRGAPRLSPRGIGDIHHPVGTELSLLRTIDRASVPHPTQRGGGGVYDKHSFIDMDKSGRVMLPPGAPSHHHRPNHSEIPGGDRKPTYVPAPPHFGGQPHPSSSNAALLSAYTHGTSRYGGGN